MSLVAALTTQYNENHIKACLLPWEILHFEETCRTFHHARNDQTRDDSVWAYYRRSYNVPSPKKRATAYKTSRAVLINHLKKGRVCIGTRAHPGCQGCINGTFAYLRVSEAFSEPPRCIACTRKTFVVLTRAKQEISAAADCKEQKHRKRMLVQEHARPCYNKNKFLGNWVHRDMVGLSV